MFKRQMFNKCRNVAGVIRNAVSARWRLARISFAQGKGNHSTTQSLKEWQIVIGIFSCAGNDQKRQRIFMSLTLSRYCKLTSPFLQNLSTGEGHYPEPPFRNLLSGISSLTSKTASL